MLKFQLLVVVRWEDWESYLTNFSGFGEGPASTSGGPYTQ
jgi:hypothetical protein